MVALVLAGLFAPGVAGAVPLLLVAGGLGWLASVSWPRLTPAGRAARVLVVGLVVAYAAFKATQPV